MASPPHMIQGHGEDLTHYLLDNPKQIAWSIGKKSKLKEGAKIFIWRSQAGQNPNYRGIIGHGRVTQVTSREDLENTNKKLYQSMLQTLSCSSKKSAEEVEIKLIQKGKKIASIELDPIQKFFLHKAIIPCPEIQKNFSCFIGRKGTDCEGFAFSKICGKQPTVSLLKMKKEEYEAIYQIWNREITLKNKAQSPDSLYMPMSPLEEEEGACYQPVSSKEELTQEEKDEIGRKGEQYAFKWLKEGCEKYYKEKYSPYEIIKEDKAVFKIVGVNQKKNLKRTAEITWHNADENTMAPVDIWIQNTIERKGELKKRKFYIEVKSTKKSQGEKSIATISRNQIKYMEKYQDKFQIFRVYGICPDSTQSSYAHTFYKGDVLQSMLFGQKAPSKHIYAIQTKL